MQAETRTSKQVVHGKETCPSIWRVSIPITPISLQRDEAETWVPAGLQQGKPALLVGAGRAKQQR